MRQAPDQRERRRSVLGADLFREDDSYYIDLPGHPRTPGCGYEQHFKERMGDQPPVVYAHVAVEEGKGVAVQYYFWYYFNDFNDKHEGDWEMIQLTFDADSVEAALEQDPDEVAFAQHNGGESADWDAPKLEIEDGHPVVYIASGSHASFYGPGIWLGWGQDGSGLGCDVTTGPSIRLTPEVRLVPDDVADPSHPFAWAAFDGRWGERDSWVYNGPTGPNMKRQWSEPISWQEGLRTSSLQAQSAQVLGPTSTEVFCGVVEQGSNLFTLSKPYPWAVGGGLLLALAVGVWLLMLAWPTLKAAWRVYRSEAALFVAIGAVVLPLALIVGGLHHLLENEAAVGAGLGVSEDDSLVATLMSLTLNVQQFILAFFVTPAVIQTVGDIRAGRKPGWRRAFAVAVSRLWPMILTTVMTTIIPLLLAVTVIGIPWAILWFVRWWFADQAVILEGKSGRSALVTSSNAVRGHWWRALAVMPVLLFVGAAVGPIVGIALLVLARAPIDLANAAGAVVFAVAHPFSVIGATLLYRELKSMPHPEAQPSLLDRLRPAVAKAG